MTKWEYLEVSVIYLPRGDFKVYTIMVNGSLAFKDDIKPAQTFVYFHQLGKDGWELVLSEPGKFYFKRSLESID